MEHRKLSMDELNRISPEEYKTKKKTPFIFVLDNIRSMNNVGSFFRTADAFRIESIHLCGITATPPNKEIHKTALGSTETVDWKYFENTLDSVAWLKSEGFMVYAVEQVVSPIFLHEFKIGEHTKNAFVFGNEVFGVSDEVIAICDGCIEIPQIGTKHSLNVSVSAGMVIWEAYSQWLCCPKSSSPKSQTSDN